MPVEKITKIDNRAAYRKRLAIAHKVNPLNVDLIRRVLYAKLFPIND
ncbi:hypothetical protein [Thalassotalea piscium]|uniref:Uncharacterized protein n=1 Tax=Thalassotalea piscium TaxID=1230533 RepID=A0A7X0TT47_9GAMM|nr:hypothetical protein [Thalassotalea piscium]MBB6542867.1 hypothetical protein [Thalassotalea piscium]